MLYDTTAALLPNEEDCAWRLKANICVTSHGFMIAEPHLWVLAPMIMYKHLRHRTLVRGRHMIR